MMAAIETPTNDPNTNGNIYVKFICSLNRIALVLLELIWIIACIGIIINGFIIETMISINKEPPPSPNDAVTVAVKKLLKHKI